MNEVRYQRVHTIVLSRYIQEKENYSDRKQTSDYEGPGLGKGINFKGAGSYSLW